VAQLVEPSKHEALSSNPRVTKKRKEGRDRGKAGGRKEGSEEGTPLPHTLAAMMF
jgi:hypothetical protein